MNSKTKAAAIGLLAALIALPVFALEASVSATVGATVDAKVAARITKGKDHADQEIDRRVAALNDMNTKVQAMVKVLAPEKSALAAAVSTEVSNLTALKAKIDADTDLDTLKADIKTITSSYRIFVLIIPQAHIEIAADKINTTASLMADFAGKLSIRIADAKTAGKDTTTLETTLADMNAKITDAQTQGAAAILHVSGLTPDMGDKAKMDANKQAMQLSRADLRVGVQDLNAARKDMGVMIKGLVSLGSATSTSATSTTTTP